MPTSRLWHPDRVIGTESVQTGTQRATEKAQRATERNSVKLYVSSVLSVFLKSSAFVGVTRSGLWQLDVM
jgi:hypothetical protein